MAPPCVPITMIAYHGAGAAVDGEGEGALAGLGARVLGVARARVPVGQLGQAVGAVGAAALLGRLGRLGRLGLAKVVCVGRGGTRGWLEWV